MADYHSSNIEEIIIWMRIHLDSSIDNCMSCSYMSICMTTWPSSVKRSLEVLGGTNMISSRRWSHRNFPPQKKNAPLHGDDPSLPLCMSCEAESGPQRRPTPHVRRESGSWRSIRQCDYQLNCEEYNPTKHKTNISNRCFFLGKPNKFFEWVMNNIW